MAKFNRKSWNHYERPKQQNVFLKKRPPSISTRHIERYDDICDNSIEDNSCNRILKISCSTSNPDCWLDLMNQLEMVITRHGGMKTELKPINPIFKSNQMEFYLQVTRSNQKLLRQYHHEILNKYKIRCHEYSEMHVPSDFPDNWIELIKTALKSRFSVISDGRTQLDLSEFAKDKFLMENNLILRLYLPTVIQKIVGIIQPELTLLYKLDLKGNKLKSITKFKDLLSNVKIEVLDLSDNNICDFGDIAVLKEALPNSIRHLIILNNEINRRFKLRKLSELVCKIQPSIELVNNSNVAETIVRIAGDVQTTSELMPKKSLPATVRSNNINDEVFQFFLKFISQMDLANRDQLCNYYSSDSVFTMATYSNCCYRNYSNNYLLLRDRQRRLNNIKRGKIQIAGVLADFPPTKHLIGPSLDVKTIARTESFSTFHCTGLFVELPSKTFNGYRVRPFARFMIVIQGGIVLQDHLDVFPYEQHLLHKHKAEVDVIRLNLEFAKHHSSQLDINKISLDEVEIVRVFQLSTQMKLRACLELLNASANIDDALAKFNQMKETNQIPADLFGLD